MKRPPPACPFCGSSATLPFENDEPEREGSRIAEIALTASIFFLSLFAILLLIVLSRADLPIAVILAAILFLSWRRRRERARTGREKSRRHVCLDCNRNFST